MITTICSIAPQAAYAYVLRLNQWAGGLTLDGDVYVPPSEEKGITWRHARIIYSV
jgi:hypothetical protein